MNALSRGVSKAKEATQKDAEGKFEEACELYQVASELLIHANKYEPMNKETKDKINHKVSGYIKRAEAIKEMLKKKQTPVADGGGSAAKKHDDGGGSGGGNNDENDESTGFNKALESAIVVTTPDVQWSDVIGLTGAKDALKETVIFPVKFPNMFTGKRRPWKGILLYGPPGTGKTFLAKAVATEAGGSTFLSVSSADLVSKWVGESEKLVRALFRIARERKPSIVFVDEIDSLCSSRSDSDSESGRRIKNEFLVQMSGLGPGNSDVLVLGATNIPWALDTAIRRRFEKRLYIPLPEAPDRTHMLKVNLGATRHSISDQNFIELGQQTNNYSGADLDIVVRDALMMPIRKAQSATHFKQVTAPSPNDPTQMIKMFTPCSPGDPAGTQMSWTNIPDGQLLEPPVTMNDMKKALENNKPNINDTELEKQRKFTREFGQDGS